MSNDDFREVIDYETETLTGSVEDTMPEDMFRVSQTGKCCWEDD